MQRWPYLLPSSSSPTSPSSTIFGVPHSLVITRAEVEVPPEVVGELLRTAVGLPLALDREVVVVEQEHPAGAVALGVAERRHVDPVGPAVDGVRAAVAGLAGDLLGLDDLDELRRPRVVLDVEHVDARAAQPGHEQVAALDVRVRRPRAERRGARVPAEVVQLVADVGHVEPADELPVGRRALLEVEHRDRVGRAVAVACRCSAWRRRRASRGAAAAASPGDE